MSKKQRMNAERARVDKTRSTKNSKNIYMIIWGLRSFTICKSSNSCGEFWKKKDNLLTAFALLIKVESGSSSFCPYFCTFPINNPICDETATFSSKKLTYQESHVTFSKEKINVILNKPRFFILHAHKCTNASTTAMTNDENVFNLKWINSIFKL